MEGTVFALYGGLQPVFTAVLAYFVLGEKPPLSNLYGGALIFAGLLLTSYAQGEEEGVEVLEDADKEEW